MYEMNERTNECTMYGYVNINIVCHLVVMLSENLSIPLVYWLKQIHKSISLI